jgi:hypothetical protein
MFKPKKSKKVRFNNAYRLPNDIADEIFACDNTKIVEKATNEYNNWCASLRLKKNDSTILGVKESIKDINDNIKENPEYQKLEEEFKTKKEELVSEELASFKQQLTNLTQPYNEDIKRFRDMFKLAMDEITKRKQSGTMK